MAVAVDILSGVSVDWLKALTWISAILTGLLLGLWRPRRLHLAALGSVFVFLVTNAGAGIYVLNHVGDPRWSGKAEDRVGVPPLTDTPVVGRFLESLEAQLRGIADNVNHFVDFSAALPQAMEFFVAAGWALVISLPLALAALIFSYAEARRRKAEFLTYKLQDEELKRDLEDVKRRLASPERGQAS
jgi:hypothetical protein